jgi:4-amino-4-deoxy-L-arabinose transferase-like glycosyltransferase
VWVVWGGIYLPGLGRGELKGEEGKRTLPAVSMMKNGNWVVPKVAGEDYYHKPPGINWLIAASFAITGQQTELTARLPSVVFVLILASVLIWLPYPWLGLEARLVSSIVFLTTIGIITKGRLIEIEAVYISLTGIAILVWLYIWSTNGSMWSLWIIPSIVLGFGMLVKGPFIFIFFYSVVISVLAYAKRLRDLLRVPHFVGIGIVFVMTGWWLYLAFQQTSASSMATELSRQLLMRIIVKPCFPAWGRKFLGAIATFLPWLLFLPMLWDKKLTIQIEQSYAAIFRGCRLGLVVSFTVINMMPGMFARYSMPAIPMACVLLGMLLVLGKESVHLNLLWKKVLLVCFPISCLTAATGVLLVTKKPVNVINIVFSGLVICATLVVFWKRKSIQGAVVLSLVTSALVVILMLQYSTFGQEVLISKELRRPAAMKVNKIVPAGDTIYIFKPRSLFLPTIFYLRPPIDYVSDANEINEQVHYLIVEKPVLEKLKSDGRISGRSSKVLYKFNIPRECALLQLDWGLGTVTLYPPNRTR